MALCLREVRIDFGCSVETLPRMVATSLGLDERDLTDFHPVRRALDARRKSRVQWVYTVEFSVPDEEGLLRIQAENPYLSKAVPAPMIGIRRKVTSHRSLVVGMGPAGLFAAKLLAEAGAAVTLLERGRLLEKRVRDVEHFWETGSLDVQSNVQFGEGGAGTFSDGKLTTRVNHPWMGYVLQTLVDFGAPEGILMDARPHVGTDRLRGVLVRFRKYLQNLGVDIRFETGLTDLQTRAGRVVSGVTCRGDQIDCDSLVLAPGHSARDTYRMLDGHAVRLEPKGFAIGLRVEHPAALINRIQYGKHHHPALPTADYVLRYNDQETGRGIYSFCMCPGGEVINAASEEGGLVVNGMSHAARSDRYSNSALVVTVGPDDWSGNDALAGMRFQQHWEHQAFVAGGGGYRAPAQNLLAFLQQGRGPITSSCRPPTVEADLERLLPRPVVDGLRRALPQFDRKMRGFVTGEAVLIGVETRTSAPVRIVRDENGESVSHPGLFPAGEGAGYAGGIMSSALDGLRVAEKIISRI